MIKSYKGHKVLQIPIDEHGYVKVEDFVPYGSKGYSVRFNYYLAEILDVVERKKDVVTKNGVKVEKKKEEIRHYIIVSDGLARSREFSENHIYKASCWDDELKRQKSTYYLVVDRDGTKLGVIEASTYNKALKLMKSDE
jgi:hypothetical protein